jgi:hypothetical protein
MTVTDSNKGALQNSIHYVQKQAAASLSVPAVFAAERTKNQLMTTWTNVNFRRRHLD